MASQFIKGLLKSRPYWLLIAAASFVPALLNVFTSYMNSRFVGRGRADWGAVVFAGPHGLSSGTERVMPVRCDHTRDSEVEAAFRRIISEQDWFDILVNNVWGGTRSDITHRGR